MRGHWASFGIGFVAGLRSMTACAALSWAAALGRTSVGWIPAGPGARRCHGSRPGRDGGRQDAVRARPSHSAIHRGAPRDRCRRRCGTGRARRTAAQRSFGRYGGSGCRHPGGPPRAGGEDALRLRPGAGLDGGRIGGRACHRVGPPRGAPRASLNRFSRRYVEPRRAPPHPCHRGSSCGLAAGSASASAVHRADAPATSPDRRRRRVTSAAPPRPAAPCLPSIRGRRRRPSTRR